MATEVEIFNALIDHLTTRKLFPKLYNGFKEIESLIAAEDELISLLKDAVKTASKDLVLSRPEFQVMSRRAIEEWEKRLGLFSETPETSEERQQRIWNYCRRDLAINEETLQELARNFGGSNLIKILTDYEKLILDIYAEEGADITSEQLLKALIEIMPIAPQNLALRAVFNASIEKSVTPYYAQIAAENAHLSLIEFTPPTYNGYTFDATTNKLLNATWNDEEETLEVEDG